MSFINGAIAKKHADGPTNQHACSGNCTRLSPNPNVMDVFYVGSVGDEGKLEIAGHLFADELSEPIPASLLATFETTRREMSLADLRADLPEEKRVSIDD